MSPSSDFRTLRRLARLYGVQTAYYNVFRRRTEASTGALLAVLRALGAPINKPEDAISAWRERQQSIWQRPLEPVTVAWDGELSAMQVRLPATPGGSALAGYLKFDTGERQDLGWKSSNLPVRGEYHVEGSRYLVKELTLPEKLPPGYHHLVLELAGKVCETFIISAPRRAYSPPGAKRTWGAFIPLYALQSRQSWGSGDFSDLEALAAWVGKLGGGMVATLPFLASFLDEPFAPSPYSPASRLLWNELYLNIEVIPELLVCPAARSLLASSDFQEELSYLRRAPLVDYRRQMTLKRRVLEELCRCFFNSPSPRLEELNAFSRANAAVEDYARFRAVGELHHASWPSWPQPLRDGIVKEGSYDEGVKRYHLYVQWLAERQIQALSGKANKNGVRLYLDLPLGVNSDGYDVWRERQSFALDASAGAPPDVLFTSGQNWNFPPLHPERIREQGYSYVRAYLRHHLKYAGILRIDHVMGLHRLYWIPHGLKTDQGIYVRYKTDELYAILALESTRNRCIIVGEDLGMVPPEVRPAMRQHNIYRMYVMGYELYSDPQKKLRPVPAKSAAYLETHDMPPFAAFWRGLDIDIRHKIKLLDETGAYNERENRRAIREALIFFLHRQGWLKEGAEDTFSILRACLALLSASRGKLALVNIEDLWLETGAHNIPGTEGEYPNWRRKARYNLETFCQMPGVTGTLEFINLLRSRGRDGGGKA